MAYDSGMTNDSGMTKVHHLMYMAPKMGNI